MMGLDYPVSTGYISGTLGENVSGIPLKGVARKQKRLLKNREFFDTVNSGAHFGLCHKSSVDTVGEKWSHVKKFRKSAFFCDTWF